MHSFFEFLTTYETQKNDVFFFVLFLRTEKNAMFFCKERKRTQRTFWKGGKWGRGGWACCVLESYLTGVVGLLPEGCHTREVSFKNVQWAGVMLD